MQRIKEVAILLALLLIAGSVTAEGKLYKWIDKNGVIHYGDKIPPDAIEFQHAELNEQGLTIKSVERQKTQEELAVQKLADEKAREEQELMQKAIMARQIQDKILLDTFTTERDLLLTRKDRISSVDSMINLMLSNNRTLDQQVKETENQVETIKNNGQDVPENILKKLENLKGQQTKNIKFIAEQNAERQRIVDQFDQDLLRYRELKAAEATSQSLAEKMSEKTTTATNGEKSKDNKK